MPSRTPTGDVPTNNSHASTHSGTDKVAVWVFVTVLAPVPAPLDKVVVVNGTARLNVAGGYYRVLRMDR